MNEVPAHVIEAALEWCRQRDYDPGADYKAVFVPKDHEFNHPDEERDLWHIFFHPVAMRHFATNFFTLVVDPDTLQVESRG
ncbi:MAG: hypothetical protein K2X82_23760 [Gemmataceae bacterium]|nr:hypothetical protein [Gemmataceae bacterium]